jgi:hypothetical protein
MFISRTATANQNSILLFPWKKIIYININVKDTAVAAAGFPRFSLAAAERAGRVKVYTHTHSYRRSVGQKIK